MFIVACHATKGCYMKNKILVALLIFVMLSSLVSCKSIKKLFGKSQAETTVASETAAVPEKPARQAEPAKPVEISNTVAAPAAEPKNELEIKSSATKDAVDSMKVEFDIIGNKVTADVFYSNAVFSYPSSISKDDILGFVRFVNKCYPEYLSGVTYEFKDGNSVVVYYPASAAVVSTYSRWIKMIDFAVAEYLNWLSPVNSVSITHGEDGKSVTLVSDLAESDEYVAVKFNLAGYEIAAEVGEEHAKLVYPDSISKDDIVGFAEYVSSRYPAYVSNLKYTFMSLNNLMLDYPAGAVNYANVYDWISLADAAVMEYISIVSPAKTEPSVVAVAKPEKISGAEFISAFLKAFAEAFATDYTVER